MADIGLINAGLASTHLVRPRDVPIAEVFFEVFSLRALTGLGGTV